MPLVVEYNAGWFEWRHAGTLHPGDQPGSVSNCQPGGRDVIVFWCEPDRSVVSRSAGGTDYTAGPLRTLLSEQLEELASLAAGESFELPVTTDRGVSARLRWTHTGDGD